MGTQFSVLEKSLYQRFVYITSLNLHVKKSRYQSQFSQKTKKIETHGLVLILVKNYKLISCRSHLNPFFTKSCLILVSTLLVLNKVIFLTLIVHQGAQNGKQGLGRGLTPGCWTLRSTFRKSFLIRLFLP